MKSKALDILILLLMLIVWNTLMAYISNNHIAPHLIIWVAGLGTGCFINLYVHYQEYIKK